MINQSEVVATDRGTAIDWNGTITASTNEKVTLPEGVYPFYVKEIERSLFNGSEKMIPCTCVKVKMVASAPDGRESTFAKNFYLNSKCENFLCEFMICIGMMKPGETINLDWENTVSRQGHVELGIRTYTNASGTHKINEAIKFLAPEVVSKVELDAPVELQDAPF